jgi:hypothetical protein
MREAVIQLRGSQHGNPFQRLLIAGRKDFYFVVGWCVHGLDVLYGMRGGRARELRRTYISDSSTGPRRIFLTGLLFGCKGECDGEGGAGAFD